MSDLEMLERLTRALWWLIGLSVVPIVLVVAQVDDRPNVVDLCPLLVVALSWGVRRNIKAVGDVLVERLRARPASVSPQTQEGA